MAVVKELMRTEQDGTLSFGDYTLAAKTKLADYDYQGDAMKVKTFAEITKLEKNGLFVYESVPGTAVENMEITADGMKFTVYGTTGTQITVGLSEEQSYKVAVEDAEETVMTTNKGGKLTLSLELEEGKAVHVCICK